MKKKPLFDDNELYLNESGLYVFTAEYLLKRGYCCGNACLNCPYDYKNVVNLEKKKRLLEARKKSEPQHQ
jgi:hypothetical protein